MYFLDTYAMLEYVKGNRKCVEMIESNVARTSDFQLIELYYITLREQGEELAEKYFEAFALNKVQIPEKTLKNAMKTKAEFHAKGKKISYVDAIGYQYAKENNLKFLTGDKEFEKEENVEFVK
ncbi:PIN domain-containing protein [Candidatus Micrarchaeota archaeon]|nr:PIN domain-containing protein [Candidatus Micrarchaeota archaeon]